MSAASTISSASIRSCPRRRGASSRSTARPATACHTPAARSSSRRSATSASAAMRTAASRTDRWPLRASARLPAAAADMRIFEFDCTAHPHPFYGNKVVTNDPGKGLITGKCADLGKTTVPQLLRAGRAGAVLPRRLRQEPERRGRFLQPALRDQPDRPGKVGPGRRSPERPLGAGAAARAGVAPRLGPGRPIAHKAPPWHACRSGAFCRGWAHGRRRPKSCRRLVTFTGNKRSSNRMFNTICVSIGAYLLSKTFRRVDGATAGR